MVFQLDSGDAEADLRGVLRRITDALAEPFDLAPAMVVCSASIGAVVCDCGHCDLDDMFRSADHGLYDVKRAGRNDFVVGSCASHTEVGPLDSTRVDAVALPV